MKHRKQHVFKSAVLLLKHVPTMVAVKKFLLLSCYLMLIALTMLTHDMDALEKL